MNIPINQPTLPDLKDYIPHLKRIFKSRQITNNRYVSRFEEAIKKQLRVKNVVAVANATSGLILTLKVLGVRGHVLVPGFTFCASAHAIAWNGLTPVFVECDPRTFNVDFDDLERKITPQVCAIVAVHVFGNPIDMPRLERLARKHRLKLVIDAAHALGSQINGKSVASSSGVTVFSLAPTKLTTSAEGGVIVTDDPGFAKTLRLARNYGNPPDYNCQFIGLNARMSEIHAALGLESFKLLPGQIAKRNKLAALYKRQLCGLPGIRFQEIAKNNLSTYNYFAIVIEKRKAKVDAATLKHKLSTYGIQTKRYFYPPVHKQIAYRRYIRHVSLKVTEELSNTTLCLPLYSHMDEATVRFVCDKVKKTIA